MSERASERVSEFLAPCQLSTKCSELIFNWQLGPGELYLVHHAEASLSQLYNNHCVTTVVMVII